MCLSRGKESLSGILTRKRIATVYYVLCVHIGCHFVTRYLVSSTWLQKMDEPGISAYPAYIDRRTTLAQTAFKIQ